MTGFPEAHARRVAIVTGGATGLGRAFAERLARDGAKVVAADVNDCTDTADAIESAGGLALAVRCDVSDPQQVEDLKKEAIAKFQRCDILVNNAGTYPQMPFSELTFETWRRVLSINLDGMFLTCKAFSPLMAENGFGRIINVSSDTFDLPVPGFVHYIASKGGVIGLTRGLATDLGAAGITVNCILPGLTITPAREEHWRDHPVLDQITAMQAIKRRAKPSDLEGTVSFLATEDAEWVTGQSIVVDGGYVRR